MTDELERVREALATHVETDALAAFNRIVERLQRFIDLPLQDRWGPVESEATAALAELKEQLGAALDREAGTSDALDAERERTATAERERDEWKQTAERESEGWQLAVDRERALVALEAQMRELVEALERIAKKELVPHWTSFQQLESCREVARNALAKVRG